MNCPVCGKPMWGTTFTCGECWWKIRPKDRRLLYSMHQRRQDTTSKMEQVLKYLKPCNTR